MSPADAEIVSTFEKVLGRNPDPIEFVAASELKLSAKDLGTALRESPEYKTEKPVDSVITSYFSKTGECPSVEDVKDITQAAGDLKPEEIRQVLGDKIPAAIVDKGAQSAPPEACPQSAEAVEFATALARNFITSLSTITTLPKLTNVECEGKKDSLSSAIATQRVLITGTQERVKRAQKDYDASIAGTLNGFISGVSGVTEAAFKNLQAEMDLLRAQRDKLTEFDNTLKAWSCDHPTKWKPLIQTEANKKADAAFREQLDSATYELASTEAALKNSQQALVAGASVVAVLMSGGLTAPMLLVYGASSGTAIGVVTATTEGATNAAIGNKTVDRAARDAAWDSLGYTYTAGVTSASLLTGGAALKGAQHLIQPAGATGVRLVLYKLGAGAAAGGAAGVVGQLNKAPAIFSGAMTPAEALKSAAMDTLFSLLGGSAGAATTSVTKEALSDVALTAIQLWAEGKLTPAEILENGPSTAINIIIGGLAGAQKVPGKKQDGIDGSLPGKQAGADPAVKDLTGKIPDSVRDQSSRPDDAHQKPGDQTGDSNLPEQGVNLEILPGIRPHLYTQSAQGALERDTRGAVVSVKLNMGGTQEYFQAYQVDTTYTNFFYLKESDFKKVAKKWLNTDSIRQDQVAVQVGSRTIVRIPEGGFDPGRAIMLNQASREAFLEIENIKQDEASGVSQYQAYRNFFQRKLVGSVGANGKPLQDVYNVTIAHLFDMYAANTPKYKAEEPIRDRGTIANLLKEIQARNEPKHPFVTLIKNLNSAEADMTREAFETALIEATVKHQAVAMFLFDAYEFETSELVAVGRGSIVEPVRSGATFDKDFIPQMNSNYYDALFRSIRPDPDVRIKLARSPALSFHKLTPAQQTERLVKIFQTSDFQQEIRDNSPLKLTELAWRDPLFKLNGKYLQVEYSGRTRTFQLPNGKSVEFDVSMRYHTRTSTTYEGLPSYRIALSPGRNSQYRYEYSTLKPNDPLLQGVDHIVDSSGNVFVKYVLTSNNDYLPVTNKGGFVKSDTKQKLGNTTHIEYVPLGMVLEK